MEKIRDLNGLLRGATGLTGQHPLGKRLWALGQQVSSVQFHPQLRTQHFKFLLMSRGTEDEPPSSKVCIDFMIQKDGEWDIDRTVLDDPENKWEFKRVAIKYKRKNMEILNSDMTILGIETFVEDLIEDWTYTVFVVHRFALNATSETHQDGPRRKIQVLE
ncbi:hypothetical protein K469DRAFT_683354 [Zopfia rhizophila CBS 207.26]|uniref:Uncharacterized protein n=1 Tax=Zopfia rhizophila CBS 207.26 TaxID=1314779 RepID=A0A6A6DC13_9PEZI|nr:hypothetical protein K469DRAFT_683354 [Zopfia rhizophila CBS 207.26]